ncbi:MAG: hypoxanthine phosphoribosyltransferase [Reichenbachiella sp.]
MIINELKFEKYISEQEIDDLVQVIAEEIIQTYQGKELILVGVLNGAFMFVSDLVKKLTVHPEIHFIKCSSYKGTSTTGKVQLDLDLDVNLKGKHVLIVEDIVDTGNTLVEIAKEFQSRGAASLKFASLLLKPDVYDKDIPLDFIGKEIPNDFVIGYGMDLDGKGRELKAIYRTI